jgi:hypothetical protein
MNVFTETKYGLTGKELEDMCGAIADNAIDAARKAAGVDHLPKTSDDKRKRDMIGRVLNSLHQYDAALPEGTLVAPFQVRTSKAFDELESKLADALNLADEPEPVVKAKLPQKAVA